MVWPESVTQNLDRDLAPEFGIVTLGEVDGTHAALAEQRGQAIRAEAPPDQRNLLLIHIDYRVRANNSVFNLVYPFYLLEGVR